MEEFDVCVIGGGMAGASVAYYLAPHARVLLLEREAHVGYHSTGRSAALFSPQYGSLTIRRLTAATSQFMTSPPAGFAADALLTPRGFMMVGTDAQREALEKLQSLADATGSPLIRLSADELRARVPVLRPGIFDWAALDNSAMDMDVNAILQGFLRGARGHGAKVATGEELLALERQGALWRARSTSLEFKATIVVNASGAWADEIAACAAIAPLGLTPNRRTAFNFDPPAGTNVASWPMIIDAAERFYFKPDAGRLLGSLAEEEPSAACDAQPDDLDVAVAVDRIEQVIEFPIQRVVRAWAGLRTFSSDRDPVSGFEPTTTGFYWHAAIGGYGIQTAAALGHFAATRILGQPAPGYLMDTGFAEGDLDPSRLR
ncbi:MAG: FAD-dependent oxidoreductase [Proteobacteria bacterium]|nr:FAD-dependent oxidoreductase [Pseudomonadota bacterium]